MPKPVDLRAFGENLFQINFHTLSGDKAWEGTFADAAALALSYVKEYGQLPLIHLVLMISMPRRWRRNGVIMPNYG